MFSGLTSSFPALTTGVWGLLIVGLFALARSVVTSRADQKRASNEGTTADSQASDKQFARLEKEIERLTERVLTLELASHAKDTTIAQLTAMKLEVLAERAAERVINTAAMAEKDAVIAALKAQIGADAPLVVATQHMADATGRVAKAAEQAALAIPVAKRMPEPKGDL